MSGEQGMRVWSRWECYMFVGEEIYGVMIQRTKRNKSGNHPNGDHAGIIWY